MASKGYTAPIRQIGSDFVTLPLANLGACSAGGPKTQWACLDMIDRLKSPKRCHLCVYLLTHKVSSIMGRISYLLNGRAYDAIVRFIAKLQLRRCSREKIYIELQLRRISGGSKYPILANILGNFDILFLRTS